LEKLQQAEIRLAIGHWERLLALWEIIQRSGYGCAHFCEKNARRNNYLFERGLFAHKHNKRSQWPMASVISACGSSSNGVIK
jgi:hypothetical protein